MTGHVRSKTQEDSNVVDVVPLGHGEEFEQTKLEMLEYKPYSGNGPELIGGLVPDVRAKMKSSIELVTAYLSKVERNPRAIEILANLFEQRVLNSENFGDDFDWSHGVALALLAASRLADVDIDAVRLRDDGEEYVKSMRALAQA